MRHLQGKGEGYQAPRLHEGRIAREGWKRVIEKLGLNPRREIPYIKRRDRTPPIYQFRGCPYNFALVRVNQ